MKLKTATGIALTAGYLSLVAPAIGYAAKTTQEPNLPTTLDSLTHLVEFTLPSDQAPLIRGDSNADGKINIEDCYTLAKASGLKPEMCYKTLDQSSSR